MDTETPMSLFKFGLIFYYIIYKAIIWKNNNEKMLFKEDSFKGGRDKVDSGDNAFNSLKKPTYHMNQLINLTTDTILAFIHKGGNF